MPNGDFGFGMQGVDIGVGTAAIDAFSAGAVPDPGVNTDNPPDGWVWRDSLNVLAALSGPESAVIVREDLRSRRRMEDKELYLVVDNTNLLVASFGVKVAGLIRCLYLLP